MRIVQENVKRATRVVVAYALAVVACAAALCPIAPPIPGTVLLCCLLVWSSAVAAYGRYYIRPDHAEWRARHLAIFVTANTIAGAVLMGGQEMLATGDSTVAAYAGVLGGTLAGVISIAVDALFGLCIEALFDRWRAFPEPHQCRQCAYDLTGNTSGRCPECGTPTASQPAP